MHIYTAHYDRHFTTVLYLWLKLDTITDYVYTYGRHWWTEKRHIQVKQQSQSSFFFVFLTISLNIVTMKCFI